MENDLQAIYEQNYLNSGSGIISEAAKQVEKPKKFTAKDDDEYVAPKVPKSKKMNKFKKAKTSVKKKTTAKEAGEMYSDSTEFSSHFKRLLKEFADDGTEFDDQNSFDTGNDDFESSDDEQTFTLTELRGMTLGEIMDLFNGNEENSDDFNDDFDDDNFSDDQVPMESYDQGGNVRTTGAQGKYDGTASRQAKSTFVKDNGDAKLDDQDTGYDPEDTEGNEGSEHGAQGEYDGKAKKQKPNTFVKDNGDVNRSQKTGYGKPDGKNYF